MVSQHQNQAVGLSHAERRARLREKVFQPPKRGGIVPDAVLVNSPPNLFYLTGFTGSFAMLVVTPETEHLLTGGIYITQIQREVPDIPCMRIPIGVEPNDTLADLLQQMGVRTVGVDKANSLSALRGLRKSLRKAQIRLVPINGAVESLRRIKDAEEIRRIRQAVGIADSAFEHVLRLFQPGVAEWDIAMEIDFYIRRQGAYPAFETIAVSGPNTALPHGKPTERVLQVGDFVTVDFGARYEGYCSDLTRTVVVGKASEEQRRIYNAVREALERCIEAIRPGKRGKQIDALARKVLSHYGLEDYFGHGLGHSLGITVHDGRGLGPRDKERLEAGMVLTVEPGVYIHDFGGVRIEQDVLVTEHGCEVLSQSPVELLEMGLGR